MLVSRIYGFYRISIRTYAKKAFEGSTKIKVRIAAEDCNLDNDFLLDLEHATSMPKSKLF
jgi:hypothetical protein